MASLRVDLDAGACDAIEFSQPANARWAKSQICVSFTSSPVKHIEVGDFIAAVNGRSLTKLSYEEALSVIRGAKGPLSLKVIRPSGGASQLLVAKRGQLMRRLLGLARRIHAIHAQYQQTIQANAAAHAARADLHTRLEQLKSRHAALLHSKQTGYAEQFELVRTRAAMRVTQQRKKSLAHSFVQRRAAAEAAAHEAAAARLQALGAAAVHHSQSQALGAAITQPAAAPPRALWPAQSLRSLRQLADLRAQLVTLATQLLSILKVLPVLQATQAFCRGRVRAADAAGDDSTPAHRAGSVAAPVPATGHEDARSVISAPPLLPMAAEGERFSGFELDLLGATRLRRLLGRGGQAPPTQAGHALEEATGALNELRDMMDQQVAPRLAAAWGVLQGVRGSTDCLRGRPALPDEQVAEAPAGSTVDHVWLEPAEADAEDVRALRLACGATGVQLQLLTALHSKAQAALQLQQDEEPDDAGEGPGAAAEAQQLRAAGASDAPWDPVLASAEGSVLSGISDVDSDASA